MQEQLPRDAHFRPPGAGCPVRPAPSKLPECEGSPKGRDTGAPTGIHSAAHPGIQSKGSSAIVRATDALFELI